jgi:hypothetical protein
MNTLRVRARTRSKLLSSLSPLTPLTPLMGKEVKQVKEDSSLKAANRNYFRLKPCS